MQRDSGLKLVLREGVDPLPPKITYSLNASPSNPGPSSGDQSDATLTPGLYELAVQSDGQDVFRRQILALDNLVSDLDLQYSKTSGFSLRQTIALPQIKFAPNQKKIAPSSRPLLIDLVRLLKREVAIEILGFEVHTDANGNAEKNQELTVARAIEVRNFLLKNGVDPQRIRASGFGSDRPIASNDSKESRLLNRRVEFVIIETSELPRLADSKHGK